VLTVALPFLIAVHIFGRVGRVPGLPVARGGE
jgi:hypothetical protein